MNALGDLVGYGSDDSEEENEEKEVGKEESRIDAVQDDGLATLAAGKEENCCDPKRSAEGSVQYRLDENKTSRNEEITSFLPSASDLLGSEHGHKRHRPASGIATHRIVEQAPSKIPKNLRVNNNNNVGQRENEVLKKKPVAIGLVPPQVGRGRANISTHDPSIFTSQTQRSMHQRRQNS